MNCKILISVAALALAACTAHEAHEPAQTPTASPAAAKIEVPTLQTQDEADAQAAKAISDKNAAAEFEKLKKELAGG